MGTLYIDPELGNDTWDGQFATWQDTTRGPLKTITGASTAKINAVGGIGSEIRIKANNVTSLGNATWTNKSNTLTLASAKFQEIDNCETQWTASTNITTLTDTTVGMFKEGTKACRITPAAAFATGKMAYRATGSLNLSSYQQLSFWVRALGSNIPANTWRIDLCSDTTGDTPVYSFTLPAITAYTYMMPMVLDYGSVMSSATNIQSIAAYAIADPSTTAIIFDNFVACLPPTDAGSITHQSLVGKNDGTDKTWWPVLSLRGAGTDVKIGGAPKDIAPSGFRGYYGTTETVTTYKLDTFKTTIPASNTTIVQSALNGSTGGSSYGTHTKYSGGWDRTNMTTQGSIPSFFDGLNNYGYGLNLATNTQFLDLENIGMVRYYYNWYNNVNYNNSFIKCHSISPYFYGFYEGSSYSSIYDSCICTAYHSASYYAGRDVKYINCNSYSIGDSNSSDGNGFQLAFNSYAYNCKAYYGYQGFLFGGSGCVVSSCTTADNTQNGVAGGQTVGDSYIKNTASSETIVFSPVTSALSDRTFIHNYNNTAGDHRIYMRNSSVKTDSSFKHSGSFSWKFESLDYTRTYPNMQVVVPVAKIWCVANVQRTASLWFYNAASNMKPSFVAVGGKINGISSDVSASPSGTGAWEQVSITFTPTEDGLVEFEARCYNTTSTTTNYCWIDDFSIS